MQETMKPLIKTSLSLLLAGGALFSVAFPILSAAPSSVTPGSERIVSVGGEITETVAALGQSNKLVGVDSTSLYPEAVTQLPNVGYSRQLAAEGILSLQPDTVLANYDAGPPQVIERLRNAGVKVHVIQTGPGADQAMAGIREVAQILGQSDAGEALVADIQQQLKTVTDRNDNSESAPPKVLFVIGGAQGQMLVAGQQTRAHTVLDLAGGKNAASHIGYKPVGKEGLLLIAPDVVLVAEHALKSFGGLEALLKSSGLNLTPAGTHQRILTVNAGRLLAMGPGLGRSVERLSELLFPLDDQQSSLAPAKHG